MPPIHFLLLLILCLMASCKSKNQDEIASSTPEVRWALEANHQLADGNEYSALFVLNNQSGAFDGSGWALHFNAFLSGVKDLDPRYQIEHLKGEYWQLRPAADYPGPAKGSMDTIRYRGSGAVLKNVMAPRGFFLVKDGQAQAISWQQSPISKTAAFGESPLDYLKQYDQAAALFNTYANLQTKPKQSHKISPAPANTPVWVGPSLPNYTDAQGEEQPAVQPLVLADLQAQQPQLHLWYSGGLWHEPIKVFAEWLDGFYQTTLIQYAEEKPKLPHLELHYDGNIPAEGYEIFQLSPELTVLSASSQAGMLYALATLIHALSIDKQQLVLPLQKVVDAPRFAYRGQMLDVARNFQTKETVLKLLDLMALFKLNTFHFHLSDDEGWRLAIPGLPELTELGGKRGYTPNEHDHLPPAYGSGPFPNQSSGSGFFSREDYIEILQYAKARSIEVIPEIDLPGHARAAIKAMEAYERRTGDSQYAISDPEDKSQYNSIQDYPDNTIAVCQPSTYQFLDKVVSEIQQMHEAAGHPLTQLHTGGDEVAGGVWVAAPTCIEWLKTQGITTQNPEEIKNVLSAYFLDQFKAILDKYGLRTAGWEEIAMRREANEAGQYRYVVNPEKAKDQLLPYVWNSLGSNVTLAYELANVGYEVVICNVNNYYFDLAYNYAPEEPGFYWGGFVDTYRAWAFAPFDAVKTMPPLWNAKSPSEPELRQQTTPLLAAARKNIRGIQGQLWSETVTSSRMVEYYLWPKMIGLAERAWSGAAPWEDIADAEERAKAMAADWEDFANRLGHFTLPLLDRYRHGEGVGYRVGLPGAKEENKFVLARAEFPGLPIFFSLNGADFQRYESPIPVKKGDELQFRAHPDLVRPHSLSSEVATQTDRRDGSRRSKAEEKSRVSVIRVESGK